MTEHLNAAQLREAFTHFHTPNYAPHGINLVEARGSQAWDNEGKEYIDLAGGIAVSALGHRHPTLVQAAKDAAEHIWHLSNFWTNESAIRLAKALCEATFAERVFFGNSGAEANEAALKLARKFARETHGENKFRIVACDNSFHGRTLFTASVTGQSKYNNAFAPLPGGIAHTPFNDCDALESVLDETCCAFIVEPVQGEGGVIPINIDFVCLARELCDKHNILLIFDEIQSGMGRTGSLFAYQGLGVVPDMLTSAKALGCGLPIGAMLTKEHIATHLTLGSHGSTSGGNPFVTRVAHAAHTEISQPTLLERVDELSRMAEKQLERIDQRLGCFREIRCAGLLIGCELAPDLRARGAAIVSQALTQGVMTLVAAGGDVIRLAPALNIPADLLEEGIRRLELALEQIPSAVEASESRP